MLKKDKIVIKILFFVLLFGCLMPVIIPARGATTTVESFTQIRSFYSGTIRSTFQIQTIAYCRPVGGGFYTIYDYRLWYNIYLWDTRYDYDVISFKVIKRTSRFGGYEYVAQEYTMKYYMVHNPSRSMTFKIVAGVGAAGSSSHSGIVYEEGYTLYLGWTHKIDKKEPPKYDWKLLTYFWDYTEGPPS